MCIIFKLILAIWLRLIPCNFYKVQKKFILMYRKKFFELAVVDCHYSKYEANSIDSSCKNLV
jgi:hypothetical protein